MPNSRTPHYSCSSPAPLLTSLPPLSLRTSENRCGELPRFAARALGWSPHACAAHPRLHTWGLKC